MHPAKPCRIIAAPAAALLLLVMMLMSPASHAAALGDEAILSQLGDPVEVEIAVVEWEDIDLEQAQITAGTPEVYESFGLDYLPAIESLNFNLIGPNLNGEVKILVSSREPMQEPYLELLLVVRWPGGSLLREYVLLFDPPRAPPAAPAVRTPVTPPVSSTPATVAEPQITSEAETTPDVATANQNQQSQNPVIEVQPQQPAPIEEPPSPPVAPAVAETVTVREIDEPVPAAEVDGAVVVVDIEEEVTPAGPAPAREGDVYTVASGDNLWGIASRFGPSNADIYQVLLGIYELNRGSFINGNISLLKYGVTLRIPTTEDIASIDPATAKNLFDQRWEEGSERIEMAERGEPLPPFSSIFSPDVVRPEFNPTAPLPDAQEELAPQAGVGGAQDFAFNGALTPAISAGTASSQNATPGSPNAPGQPAAPVAGQQPALPVVSIAPALNSAGVPVPQAGTPNTPATAASVNPYLDGVNTTMQFMQEMLTAKQQQVELLEAQMSEMNTRMLEISRATERLNNSLDEALAQRENQQASDQRNTLLLAGLVAVLSIAVVAIIIMALKLAAQIRIQHELLQSSMQNRVLTATRTHVTEAKRELPISLPDDGKTRNVQKYMPPEHALSVSIIDDDEEIHAPGPSSAADADTGLDAAKEELSVQLGDMDLDQPEGPPHPESR